MKKRLFLIIAYALLSVGLYAQTTSRNVNIIKSNAAVNFNNDVRLINNASNTLVIDGGVFSVNDGLRVSGTSGLVISRLALKDNKLTAISSAGDTLTFYTKPSDLIDGYSVFTSYIEGTAAPSSAPPRKGAFYFDTTNKKLYFSTGTSSASDWVAAN